MDFQFLFVSGSLYFSFISEGRLFWIKYLWLAVFFFHHIEYIILIAPEP